MHASLQVIREIHREYSIPLFLCFFQFENEFRCDAMLSSIMRVGSPPKKLDKRVIYLVQLVCRVVSTCNTRQLSLKSNKKKAKVAFFVAGDDDAGVIKVGRGYVR